MMLPGSSLILGGSGFIGSNFAEGVKVSSKDVDLMNYEDTLKCFEFYEPETIIHAAAKQKNYLLMQTLKAEHFYDNMLMNLNIFKAAQEVGVRKVVTFASINAFPYKLNRVFNEDDLYMGEPHDTNYTDGFNNRMKHVLGRAYNDQYNLDSITLFLSNTYGPLFTNIYNGIVPLFIDKCYQAKISNEPLVILGDGSPTRDFIFVEDVIKLTNWSINNYNSVDPLILSSGKEISVREIVEEIVNIMDFKNDVIWQENGQLGLNKKHCDNSKLKKLVPDFQFTPFKEGLKKTIDWYLKQKEVEKIDEKL